MTTFFKPYEGTRPFLFISYAHKQSDLVVNTIRILHEKGYRLWYDEGIPAGSDWPANIAQHMQDCEKVVFFLSARAMESNNCYSEMRTASREGKPILIVRLEDVPFEARWEEILTGKQEIAVLDGPEAYAGAILQSGFVQKRFRRSKLEGVSFRWLGLAASLLFFIAAGGALYALATGLWEPFPPRDDVSPVTPSPSSDIQQDVNVDIGEAEKYFAVEFPDTLQERGIRRALGASQEELILRGRLAEFTELCFCGNMVTDSESEILFKEDGTCLLNTAPVGAGQISDLSVIRNCVMLEKLTLSSQPLNDLSGLSSHVLLKELNLSGSTVTSLAALKDLPSLEVLHLEHTGVKDLSPLEDLPSLQTVTVSREMLPLQWSEDAAFAVVLIPDYAPEKEETP